MPSKVQVFVLIPQAARHALHARPASAIKFYVCLLMHFRRVAEEALAAASAGGGSGSGSGHAASAQAELLEALEDVFVELESHIRPSRGPPAHEKSSEPSILDLDPDEVYNVASEISNWVLEPSASFDEVCDPIKFWNTVPPAGSKEKSLKERFPVLFVLANDYLCIPATSVPCESLFSTARKSLTEANLYSA